MIAQDILSLMSGAAVGLILAVIGGGGSILATPLLLYVVGIANPHAAIGTSALAVSVNAYANVLAHARQGNVKWPCALTFAAAGVIGAFLGAAIGKATDPKILLPLFAVVMILVGLAMLRPNQNPGDETVHLTPRMAPQVLAAGAGVGLLSGFFGIGGGFLVVPGLLLTTGMTMLYAIGSSLFTVGSLGAATAASYALDNLIDWRVAGFFIGGGVVGGLAGARLAKRLAQRRGLLQRLFAFVIFAVAGYMLVHTLLG
ncbi:MAG: sulfite exporter TauE/SafE family protein [Hyphomonadaceae bacterium]